MNQETIVFGPAYLDRVLRVDGPLLGSSGGGPLDQSVDGTLGFGAGIHLRLEDASGHSLAILVPEGWPGPSGAIRLEGSLLAGAGDRDALAGVGWSDDLGGMGAGLASALGGRLVSALGPEDDPIGRVIRSLLAGSKIAHHPVLVPDREADWTLLVTSGRHGDKLAVGFRGCHASLPIDAFDPWLSTSCGLRVVAGLPNRLSERLLKAPDARCRLFAPAMRNMRDRDCPVARFAGSIDVLCCNRGEWEALADREDVAWRVSLLVVTDGPAGAWARFTQPQGDPGTVRIPAFPRARPPVDTNRAGEAFAASLVSSLLGDGWEPAAGVAEADLVQSSMLRASVAAALVLDRPAFGFPDEEEIDEALRNHRVT
jgi:ribokinase